MNWVSFEVAGGGLVAVQLQHIVAIYDEQGVVKLATTAAGVHVLKDTTVQKAAGITGTIPWFVNNSPATAAFQQVMGDYLPQANSAPQTAVIWAGLQLFAKAAEHVSTTPTAADIYKGLYAFHDETLGGFTVPLTFGPGKTNTNECAFAYAVTKGKLSMAYGTAPICGTS